MQCETNQGNHELGIFSWGQVVNLTSYLDSSDMVSQYLLIHSKVLKVTIKGIFYDPSITLIGVSGIKLDLLPPNTFYGSNAKLKKIIGELT